MVGATLAVALNLCPCPRPGRQSPPWLPIPALGGDLDPGRQSPILAGTTRPTGSNNVRELFQEIIHELERGETVAMATIVRRKGSVPREVGAKMLVHRGGKISGTVGGGCGEAEVWRSALNVIDTRRPSTVQVELTEEIAMESQGVCGGIFDVFVPPWHNSQLVGQPAMQDYARASPEVLG